MTRTISRILVPTDFSETSGAALAVAQTFAETFGASLHLLHVIDDPYANAAYVPEVYVALSPEMRDAAVKEAQRQLAHFSSSSDRLRFQMTQEIAYGPTAKQIVEYAAAHAIDLIVMGTHGRRGVAHLMLGSVAEHVVRTAECPVLTVRGERRVDRAALETARDTTIPRV